METQELEKPLELTQEQKDQIHNLYKEIRKKGFLFGVELIALLFITNVLIVSIDAFVGHSTGFCFVSGLMNGFFLSRHMINEIAKQRDHIRSKIKEILSK
jgi:hypothetical protein